MAWIETIPENEAEGPIKAEYQTSRKRAGWVWNIVKLMSLNPASLRASMRLYEVVVHGPSPLSREQREMLAVVVSKTNGCHYCTEAHSYDLRALDGAERERKVKLDWRSAGLDPASQALLAFAEKLTRTPSDMNASDIGRLRAQGFADQAILDAVQVIAYFNYINRVADALAVDLEDWMPEKNEDTSQPG